MIDIFITWYEQTISEQGLRDCLESKGIVIKEMCKEETKHGDKHYHAILESKYCVKKVKEFINKQRKIMGLEMTWWHSRKGVNVQMVENYEKVLNYIRKNK